MNEFVPENIEKCMHDLIAEQFARQPDKPAVESWDGQLSYGEVDELSTRLAHHLSSLGVGVGSRVPLCFEKSMWTIVALLGVMKAGAAFVLTDPSQPEGRLETIVEQTRATVLVTSKKQEELGHRIAPNATVIAVSKATFDSGKLTESKSELPQVPASAPLYVIFTSGSTGKPKGVIITHANYTSGGLPRAEAVGYRSHSRVLDFASYAFDVSIDCMLATLVQGGTICVPSDEKRVNDLSGAIRDMNVNMAHMTPSVARVLDADILPSLDVLGLGGESVGAGDATIWGQHCKVIIAYGPSECTVGCTINNDVGVGRPYTTIGKGCGGVTWIVNPADHNRLAPVGGIGELLIEGPIVGEGYLDEPEKTAAVFIEDPTWLLAGSKSVAGRHGRLYKTGDLVKYDPNGSGNIVFQGRGDQQVKLRGQRVELGEIEHQLRKELPKNTSLAVEVITPGGKGGEPTLVAFISEDTKDEGKANIDDKPSFSDALRQALVESDKVLATKLPVYMVPTAYIPLDKMPLLVSCKTDRKRLREMGAAMTRQELARLRVAAVETHTPQTENEKTLHRLWTQLLGSDIEFGTRDSFFGLGGDSLRAMKLVAAARTEGLLLTVAGIFQHPILADMAQHATPLEPEAQSGTPAFSLLDDSWDAESARIKTAKLCGVDASLIEDVYPCTPLQEGLMALSAKVTDAYVAQRVLELPDIASAQKLQDAFAKAAAESVILRTRIVQIPRHGLMQVVVKDDIAKSVSNSLEAYLVQDRDDSMDLGKPLVRYGVVSDETTGKAHFVLTIHHALYDGWSMPLVVDRVNRAYNGLETERPAAFNDFIKYLNSMDRKVSEAFWKEQLNGANGPQFPALPYAGYQTRADSLLEEYITLDKRSSSSTTVATAIRGAWALVASQYTGSSDVVFGETLTGRNAPVPGVELIEGPMITTVPVRVMVNRASSVADFLQDIQDHTIERIAHEHVGLQNIRRQSPDAREACELRTGFVLHPSVEEEPVEGHEQPANGFVPADDAEAAREALKFNTYALMMVCSLDPRGFLVMASFDSNTVGKQQMESVLQQFGRIVQQLCAETTRPLAEIDALSDDEKNEPRALSNVVPDGKNTLGPGYGDVTHAWITHPSDINRLVPRGGIGELLVERSVGSEEALVTTPSWRTTGTDSPVDVIRLYKTGQLAKFDANGSVVLLGEVNKIAQPQFKAPEKKKHISATSAKQRKLRELWSRVLGLDENEIGLNDSFFQLGGDSIGAMKLVSEARLEGVKLAVTQIFRHRSLYDMADVMEDSQPSVAVTPEKVAPYSSLDVANVEKLIAEEIRPALTDQSWKITDVLPTRPLQEVAVRGTVQLPRFSTRYELFYLDGDIDKERLLKSCQELVARNEILRTVFVDASNQCLGVVLEEISVPIAEYQIAGDIESFMHNLCTLDIQTLMPLGSAFVKFFFVQQADITTGTKQSCLAFRISHAQYDEICLPLMLRQLSALYEDRTVPESLPFSTFVNHVVRKNIPDSIQYWRDLLQGSSPPSVLRPVTPVTDRNHFAIYKEFDISARSKDVTIATLPTAAWAFCLARRLNVRDVTFGEVVSGRNIDLGRCDIVTGPCWQYVPVRVKFESDWTAAELLEYVQNQHIATTSHEGVGLSEIVERCTSWPKTVDWFDTVVHQDTDHVKSLEFLGASSRMETVYPHMEPLREWKIQAFPSGDKIGLEIITFESWREDAEILLEELGEALGQIVEAPGKRLFEPTILEGATMATRKIGKRRSQESVDTLVNEGVEGIEKSVEGVAKKVMRSEKLWFPWM